MTQNVSIPLGGLLPNQQLAPFCQLGPLSFSYPALPAPQNGAQVLVQVTAGGGAGAPTFTGMTQMNPSDSWFGTPGMVHQLTFVVSGGQVYYNIYAGATALAPAFGSMSIVHGTNPNLVISIGGAALLTSAVPPSFLFSVFDGNTPLAVGAPVVTATSVTLPLTGTVAQGDTITLNYGPGGANALQAVSQIPNGPGQFLPNLLAAINGATCVAT